MRASRLFVVLSLLTVAGIAAQRPELVRPFVERNVLPLVAKVLAEPMPGPAVAEPAKSVDLSASDDSGALPAFVTSTNPLTFSEPATSGQAATTAALPAVSVTSDQRPADAPASAANVTAAVQPSDGVAKPIQLSVEPVPPRGDDTAVAPVSPEAPPSVPAKKLFGAATTPAPLSARAIGTYSRGCLSGAVALPVDGPAWQAMRLSRNRNWGHPNLVKLVERLAIDAQKKDGWSGLLVGDISQPRGGPMLTGHASHQVGLDADVWLTPMPAKRFTKKEREDVAATSMLDNSDLKVDAKIFSEKHVKLIKRAASYPEVERVLVHPAIKKALCEVAGPDRGWLGKVRPIQGHYYHFHIRIGCPPGSQNCKPQVATTGEDGCDKEVDEWLVRLSRAKEPPKPKPPGYKPPPPPPPVTMASLPAECSAVLESGPDGVHRPLTEAREEVPMGGLAEAKNGAFVAGTSLRAHLKAGGSKAVSLDGVSALASQSADSDNAAADATASASGSDPQ